MKGIFYLNPESEINKKHVEILIWISKDVNSDFCLLMEWWFCRDKFKKAWIEDYLLVGKESFGSKYIIYSGLVLNFWRATNWSYKPPNALK